MHNDLDYSIETARRVAEKMRTALAMPYVLNRTLGEDAPETKRANRKERYPANDTEIVYQGGTSIGIVMFLGDAIEQLELFAQADKAMYQAKKSGGNRVCFYGESQNTQPVSLGAS